MYFCFIDYTKAFDYVIFSTTNWKILKDMGISRPTLPASWETCMEDNKQPLELDVEQWTGSKLRKEYCQGCILSLCLFNLYAEYIHTKCWAGWLTSWNQDCWEKYQQPHMCIWYQFNGRKWRETMPLDEGERGEWKSWLKLSIQKTKIMASSPIISCK